MKRDRTLRQLASPKAKAGRPRKVRELTIVAIKEKPTTQPRHGPARQEVAFIRLAAAGAVNPDDDQQQETEADDDLVEQSDVESRHGLARRGDFLVAHSGLVRSRLGKSLLGSSAARKPPHASPISDL